MSEISESGLACPNPDCRVSEAGKCVEGFEVNSCPHQQGKLEGVVTQSAESTAVDSAQDSSLSEVPVARGKILDIDEATNVLRVGPARVVAVIGPIASGKTTFGLSLYEAFRDGPFDRWSFAGSLTLPAFEQRCHLARAESGRAHPETHRTFAAEGLGFLHLAVYCEDTGRIDLLISDRTGEYYTSVANSEEDCDDLHEVSRADYILFLLDGVKLIGDERHGIKHELAMMIATLLAGKVLSTTHQVGIVLTKYDQVVSSKTAEQTIEEFNEFVTVIEGRFGNDVGGIKAFIIAARSESEKLENRFGIIEVLEECLCAKQQVCYVPQPSQLLDRSFHQLTMVRGKGK